MFSRAACSLIDYAWICYTQFTSLLPLKGNTYRIGILPKLNVKVSKPVFYKVFFTDLLLKGLKAGDKKYYGMIAQEVEKIFPEVVKHTYGDDGKDFYTIRYNALGVLAIKAIQEQEEKIGGQDKKIEELTKLVNQLMQNQPVTAAASASSALIAKTINSSALLEQNAPNPFSSITTIRYNLPAAANAQIMVTSAAGSTVKTFTLTGKGAGTVTINGGELAAGSYRYSLIVDGKKVDTKQMILVK